MPLWFVWIERILGKKKKIIFIYKMLHSVQEDLGTRHKFNSVIIDGLDVYFSFKIKVYII